MSNTMEAHSTLENVAYMEWQNALRSGALDEEVELAYDFWQRVVALTRRVG